MGRTTWESIPEKFRPLAGRFNVVLTSAAANPDYVSPYPSGVLALPSVAAAVGALSARSDIAEMFVIGGTAAYTEALTLPQCARIFLTRIAKEIECDTFFPAIDDEKFKVVHVSETRVHNDLPYDFIVYERSGGDAATEALLKEHSVAVAAA